MPVVNPRVPRISTALVAAYRSLPPATIGHILNDGFMDPAIRPVWKRIRLAGPAITVTLPSNDNYLNREAIRQAEPGDVIVMVRTGADQHACWGEMTSLNAKVKGVAGVIIDGCITDIVEIEDMGFPAFARGISAVLGRRVGRDGEINTPVSCGGVVVHPGDLIVGDDNGIVVMAPEVAERILPDVQKAEDRAPAIRDLLLAGNFIGDFKA